MEAVICFILNAWFYESTALFHSPESDAKASPAKGKTENKKATSEDDGKQ